MITLPNGEKIPIKKFNKRIKRAARLGSLLSPQPLRSRVFVGTGRGTIDTDIMCRKVKR